MLQVDDEVTALDFDMACTTRLLVFDTDKEKRLMEAMGAGAATNTVKGLFPDKPQGPRRIRQ